MKNKTTPLSITSLASLLKNTFLVTLLIALFVGQSFSAFKPKRVTCIAPAGAGGGWDFTCRTPAAKVMRDLKIFKGTMKVINMSGAGGAVAYAHVVTKRKGNNNLIVAGSQATAVRLAQNAYTGFTHKDVQWLGAIGADYGVIAVAKDSKYNDLDSIFSAIKKNSSSVKFSGASSAGGWDHLKVLMLAKKSGIKNVKNINYVSFDNGGTAMIELIGGRVDAFTGDASEMIPQLDAGKIKLIAVLSPERISRLGNVPTAKEQGYDVIGANWRGFYAPPKTSKASYNFWADAVKKVANSKEWAELAEKNGLAPFQSFGKDFEKFLNSQIAEIKTISKELGL